MFPTGTLKKYVLKNEKLFRELINLNGGAKTSLNLLQQSLMLIFISKLVLNIQYSYKQ